MKWQCYTCTAYSEADSLSCDTCGESHVPIVDSFLFSEPFIKAGVSAIATWKTQHCDEVEIVGHGLFLANGELVLNLFETTTLILKSRNKQTNKTTIAYARIERDVPSISYFKADKSTIDFNPIVLSWEVLNYTELVLLPMDVKVSGTNTYNVDPLDTTEFVLKAIGRSDDAIASFTVELRPPEIALFEVDSSHIVSRPISVRWKARTAQHLELLPMGIVLSGAEGAVSVVLEDTTVLTLRATNVKGTTESEIRLERKLPEIEYFEVERGEVLAGEAVKLKWKVLNAEKCFLESDGEKINVALESTYTMDDVEVSKTFYLVAVDSFGEESKSEVSVKVAVIINFNIDTATKTLNWETSGFDKVRVYPPGKDVLSSGDLALDSIEIADHYSLECMTESGLLITKDLSVDLPSISMFSLKESVIYAEGELELSWKTEFADEVILHPTDLALGTEGEAMLIPWTEGIEYLQLEAKSVLGNALSRRIFLTIVSLEEEDVITEELKKSIRGISPSSPKVDTHYSPVALPGSILEESQIAFKSQLKRSFDNIKISVRDNLNVVIKDVRVRLRKQTVTLRRQVLRSWKYVMLPKVCLLYTSPSPRDATLSRMPSSA